MAYRFAKKQDTASIISEFQICLHDIILFSWLSIIPEKTYYTLSLFQTHTFFNDGTEM